MYVNRFRKNFECVFLSRCCMSAVSQWASLGFSISWGTTCLHVTISSCRWEREYTLYLSYFPDADGGSYSVRRSTVCCTYHATRSSTKLEHNLSFWERLLKRKWKCMSWNFWSSQVMSPISKGVGVSWLLLCRGAYRRPTKADSWGSSVQILLELSCRGCRS